MDERKAFEEWVKASGMFTDWSREGGPHTEGEYLKPRVRLAWEAWQAALDWRRKSHTVEQKAGCK